MPPLWIRWTIPEAAIASAQAGYQDLLVGPNTTQQTINDSQLRQAEIALNQAQQAYNKIKDQPDAGMFPQAAELGVATSSYEVAKAQAAKTEEPATQAQLAQGLNQIAQAHWVGLDSSQRPQENIQTTSGGFGQATGGEEVSTRQ